MAYRNRRRRAKADEIRRLTQAPPEAVWRPGVQPNVRAAMLREFHGTLVFPDDGDYNKDRQLSNPAFQRHPQVIAYCDTPGDVRLCLKWAHAHGWRVTCRAGGHSTAGYSINDGMVIDVSRMSYVHVDPVERRAVVGPGTRFGMLNAVLDHYKLHVPGGGCEDVAVAGYMQGGGWGFTSREYGMNCDNVLSVRVMLYDGHVVEASSARNTDLYWAIRGGTGNNFGVLLEVTYQLHQVWRVWGFGLRWNLADAPAAIVEMQDNFMTTGASPRLGYLTFLAPRGVPVEGTGAGTPLLQMRGIYHGTQDEGMRALRSLVDSRGAEVEFDEVGSYSHINHVVIDGDANHVPPPVYEVPDPWKEDKQAGFIDTRLDLAAWENVVEFYRRGHAPYNIAVIEPCGGAINAYPVEDSAYIHRGSLMDFFVDVFWYAEQDQEPQVTWLNEYMRVMRDDFNGHSYQNYPRGTLTNFRWMYWGKAFDDLLWVKKKYDPKNFFCYDQSISEYPEGTRPPYHERPAPRFRDLSIAYEAYSTPFLQPR